MIYGVTAMVAICATTLAELLGAAIGLYMLFGIPIALGAAIAAVLVGAVIWLQKLYGSGEDHRCVRERDRLVLSCGALPRQTRLDGGWALYAASPSRAPAVCSWLSVCWARS